MGIFSDNMTGWFSPVAKDGKHDLNSLSKSIELLIGVNNAELNGYTSYLIATFSILVPIYFTLWSFNAPLLIYLITIELNTIIIVILLRKMKNVKDCNEMMIETYNSIQSELGGSPLVRIDGKKEEVLKKVNEWNKKYNLKPITPRFKVKTPDA